MSPNTVALIWFGGMLAYAIWDIFLATDSVADNTESEVTRYWARRIAALPFVAGVLGAHWFHPFSTGHTPNWFEAGALVGLSGLVTGAGLLLRRLRKYPRWFMFMSMLAGNVAGLLFWRV